MGGESQTSSRRNVPIVEVLQGWYFHLLWSRRVSTHAFLPEESHHLQAVGALLWEIHQLRYFVSSDLADSMRCGQSSSAIDLEKEEQRFVENGDPLSSVLHVASTPEWSPRGCYELGMKYQVESS